MPRIVEFQIVACRIERPPGIGTTSDTGLAGDEKKYFLFLERGEDKERNGATVDREQREHGCVATPRVFHGCVTAPPRIKFNK
jgi:hypothetical protein